MAEDKRIKYLRMPDKRIYCGIVVQLLPKLTRSLQMNPDSIQKCEKEEPFRKSLEMNLKSIQKCRNKNIEEEGISCKREINSDMSLTPNEAAINSEISQALGEVATMFLEWEEGFSILRT